MSERVDSLQDLFIQPHLPVVSHYHEKSDVHPVDLM